jgi:hypothetical protein
MGKTLSYQRAGVIPCYLEKGLEKPENGAHCLHGLSESNLRIEISP